MAPEKLFDAALALAPEARLEFAFKQLASVDWRKAWLAAEVTIKS